MVFRLTPSEGRKLTNSIAYNAIVLVVRTWSSLHLLLKATRTTRTIVLHDLPALRKQFILL